MAGKRTISSRVADLLITIVMLSAALVCFFPFLYVFNNSISDPVLVTGKQIYFIPKGIQFQAYRIVLSSKSLFTAYGNTLIYTAVGTLLDTLVTLLCAYPLSRPRLLGKRFLSLFFLITMYFSGGMIPSFLMMNLYGLYDTRWAILLPAAFSCYNMIVARTYFSSIQEEILESARIEGANDLYIFFRVVVPLSKPIVAVICLYNAVYMWNVYFNALLYLPSADLQPLQVFLNKMLTTNSAGTTGGAMSGGSGLDSSLISEQIKYPAIVVTIVPILFVYPFVQKHFAKGVMLGALK